MSLKEQIESVTHCNGTRQPLLLLSSSQLQVWFLYGQVQLATGDDIWWLILFQNSDCTSDKPWQGFLACIGSDNGLALTWWQDIIWANDAQITDAYYISLSLNGNKIAVCMPSLLCIHFFIGWSPSHQSGMTLMEDSQCACNSLCIKGIWLLVYLWNCTYTWYGIISFLLNKPYLSLES